MGGQSHQYFLKDYILYNGTHLFPRKFKITYLDEEYLLELDKLTHFNESIDKYKKRLLRYEKSVKKSNPTGVMLVKPPFII